MKKLVFLILCLMTPLVSHAATHRFAVIVGNNQGNPNKPTLRYAEQDAKNLYQVLTDLGEFPKKDTLLLLDKPQQSVLDSLRQIQSRVSKIPRASRDEVLFIFYFSGHTEKSILELGSSSLAYATLSNAIQKIPAATRIVVLDTCEGGYLIQSKGGTLIPPLTLPSENHSSLPRGDILISSSTSLEEALETSEFQGSLFTHYFVLGLSGAADYNHDFRVSLNEVLSYASQQTAQKAASLKRHQQPTYGLNLTGSGEIYLTELKVGGGGITMTPSSSLESSALLREGEVIRLTLSERISSKTSHEGDKIRLESSEDVFANNQLVIAAGAPATGEILAIRKKRGLVHGELVCRLGYVQAVDGQWVPLNSIISRNPTGLKQVPEEKANDPLWEIGSHAETDFASGLTAFFFFPIYPFIKGRDVVLKEGTIFDAYIGRDVSVH